jgi:hypothetical protein
MSDFSAQRDRWRPLAEAEAVGAGAKASFADHRAEFWPISGGSIDDQLNLRSHADRE